MENTDTDRLNALRRLMGYTQNASDVTVTLSEDDATRDVFLTAGKGTRYCGSNLRNLLDLVIEDHKKEDMEDGHV